MCCKQSSYDLTLGVHRTLRHFHSCHLILALSWIFFRNEGKCCDWGSCLSPRTHSLCSRREAIRVDGPVASVLYQSKLDTLVLSKALKGARVLECVQSNAEKNTITYPLQQMLAK